MADAPGPSFTERSWGEIAESFDGENRHRDSLYPVVYTFSNGTRKRDSGPNSGIYET